MGQEETTMSTAIDVWIIGCIFAKMLTGKPLFPRKNVVHQLDLMTDLLGTPPESIARVLSSLSSDCKSQLAKINCKICWEFWAVLAILANNMLESFGQLVNQIAMKYVEV